MRKARLYIPGPVDVEDDVLGAMSTPVLPHYGEEWAEFFRKTVELAKEVFRCSGELFIFVGTGSTALDSAFTSYLRPGDKVILGKNGHFGERLEEMLEWHTCRVVEVEAPWGQPIDPDLFREAVRTNPDARAGVIVHIETSSGVLNPLPEIAEVCRQYGLPLIVDAVSSLGGTELRFDDWGLSFCATSSQKCLEAPAGLGLLAVSLKAFSLIEDRIPPQGWYLNLLVWRDYLRKWRTHPHPMTMAVNNVIALQRSLERILDEGLEERFKRYARVAKMYRERFRAMGFKVLASEACSAPTVICVLPPSGVDLKRLIQLLRRRHNIMVAFAMGKLEDRAFRVGVMGRSATPEACEYFFRSLEDSLRRLR